ncbi:MULTISPECIES: DUF1206 domain-containing protein [Trichocoleus]|uniref:DUF1206 domain-containing protein n=1 Tax=Trichocoleus desertorum GB2-A4 TaxID=2933944 RepID=A0ABV0J6T1_9CYAN|nr:MULTISPECIES: DUF1206 domain-containing protein [unclassified Trichocoleus]MBD1862450.1 DUF1206 domain-containing protein [Trichocoleus sp. FACHB-46]MBD2123996.1 DUF1206 domain-containing protein [Trichocoleus sp. FACHB-262]
MRGRDSVERASNQAGRAARQVASQPWVEPLARFGYTAKGIVYGLVGILAAQAAFGSGGKTTDSRGALQTILDQPFGQFLLGLVAIGLLGYVLWSLVQATMDTENHGTDAKGIAQRLGYVGTAIVYAGLALTAARLVLGSGGSGGGSSASQDWTARLLAQPFGQWLVGTIGAAIIGFGFYHFYKAYTAKFRRKLKLNEMSENEKTWATRMGRFGLAARGVVFAVIGFFLIQAARSSNASEVRGLGGALAALASQPYGPWLLGLVALGLVAYGIYNFVLARYRQMVIQ